MGLGFDHERELMSPHKEKLALFIDGANLYATGKSLGFDIDYKRLLREFQSRGDLLRAFYYTAVIEDQEFSSIRPLIDWLDYNGYTVVTKPTKEFVDQTGRPRGPRSPRAAAYAAIPAARYNPAGRRCRRRRVRGLSSEWLECRAIAIALRRARRPRCTRTRS